MDRSKPGVACPRAVAAVGFEVVEKGSDQWRIEFGQAKAGWRRSGSFCGEAEQQPPGVAVAGDGVRAGLKEKALARTTPPASQQGRYRPPDTLLTWLERL